MMVTCWKVSRGIQVVITVIKEEVETIKQRTEAVLFDVNVQKTLSWTNKEL